MNNKANHSNTYTALIGIVLFAALLIVMFFSEKNGFTLFETFSACVIIACTLFLYLLYARSSLDFHRFVFIAVLLFCLLNIFIQPILNIPDEQVHFSRSEILTEGVIFPDEKADYFDTIESVNDLIDETQVNVFESQSAEKEIDYSKATVERIAASNLSLFYLPQAAGLRLAEILHLNNIWLLWMARLFGAVVYAFLAWAAVKIAPKLKYFLFFMLFLPMSIQQGGSCSIDLFINGISILFIAVFIKLYCEPDHPKFKQILVAFILLGLLMLLAKITNVFICGLVLLLPLKKQFKHSWLIKTLCLILFIGAGLLYYYYTLTFTGGTASYYATQNHVDSAGQLQYILSHPVQWLSNFVKTLIADSLKTFNRLNCFGWMVYSCRYLTVIFALFYLKVCFCSEIMPISKGNKFLILLMLLGIYAFTFLAMYLSWTPVGAAGVEGVQGRYFIPALTLAGLLFTRQKKEIILTPAHRQFDMAVSLFMSASMLISVIAYYY